jgi:peptide/nickel transport system permease protein
MVSYIVRRLVSLFPMILIITFLIYLGLDLTPGDAVSHLISPDAMANVTPQQMDALRQQFGLNDPFIVRYFKWLVEMLKGNFGYSVSSGVKISDIVLRNLPSTLKLSAAALLISTILGSILGLISALKKGTIADSALTVAGMIGVSIPQFFFGLVCIMIFILKLRLFPI